MCSDERLRLVGGLVICKMDLVQSVLLVSRWSLK